MAKKHAYNMQTETRTVAECDSRPSVTVHGITYIGKARRSRIRIGEDVEVTFRGTKQGRSVTVKPSRPGSRIPEERWISVDAFYGEDD